MTVVKKEAIRHAVGLVGVGLLMSATWMQGYRSAAAKTQVQTAMRSESARGDAEAELARARKQVHVLKDLIVRYREELAYVDEQLAKGGGK